MKRIPERIWRCTCGGSHFVSIRHGDDDDFPPELLLETGYDDPSLWHRFRRAVRVLLDREHPWAEVILDAETAREIQAELRLVQAKPSGLLAASQPTLTINSSTTGVAKYGTSG